MDCPKKICTVTFKRKRIDTYFVFYLFLVLFCPPFFDKYFSILLITGYTIFMILGFNKFEYQRILSDGGIKGFLLGIFMFSAYWMIVFIINYTPEVDIGFRAYGRIIYRLLMIIISMGIYVPYIILYAKKNRYSKETVLAYMVAAACIQFFILAVFLVIPSVRNDALQLMYTNTGIVQYLQDVEKARRWYGFSISLQDGFGCGIGMITVIAYYLSLKRNMSYFLAVVLLLCVSAFNARTGLLITALGIFLIQISIKRHKFRMLFLLIFGILAALFFMKIYSVSTFEWVRSAFFQLVSLVDIYGMFDASIMSNMRDGSLYGLFSDDFWSMPQDELQWFLGTGNSTADGYGGHSSDVGYVNWVWACGMVGSVALLSFPVWLYFIRHSSRDKLWERLKIFMLASLFIGNIKFDFFTYGCGLMTFFLIMNLDILEEK